MFSAPISNLLHGLRIAAVMCVLLEHFSANAISGRMLEWVPTGIGHFGVVMFFVISGFVIVATATEREKTLGTYLVNRCARFYSVVPAALALTCLADTVGSGLHPEFYAGKVPVGDNLLARSLIHLAYAQQFWAWGVEYYSNSPLWSLSFEFWYYIALAITIYPRRPWRWGFLAVFLCVLGPKIVLMFPVWLVGVGVYLTIKARLQPAWVQVVLQTVGWAGVWPFHAQVEALQRELQLGMPFELGSASNFLGDFFVALLVAAFIHAASLLRDGGKVYRPLAALAGVTFSIYAFHWPLALLVLSFVHGRVDGPTRLFCVLFSAVGLSALLALVTEKKHYGLRQRLTASAKGVRCSQLWTKVAPILPWRSHGGR